MGSSHYVVYDPEITDEVFLYYKSSEEGFLLALKEKFDLADLKVSSTH